MTNEKQWLSELQGKTIRGVRPTHNGGAVPEVSLLFEDGAHYIVTVSEGVFFEACLINTLRRAQPVHDVVVTEDGDDTTVEIRSKTFPLLVLSTVNKNLEAGETPLHLTRKDA